MTDPETPASSGEPNASQLLAEAKQVLEEIKRLKGQAEERLKEAEAASKKADGEAFLRLTQRKLARSMQLQFRVSRAL
jgi:hypothetical protein